ncbi:MAG: phosphoribosylanthranilate isomerase [Planctomycetota bacterium]
MTDRWARTRVKICGITDESGLAAAVEAGADAVGFVFVETSPRAIEPERAWMLASTLPAMVASVGLTVDLDLDAFADIESRCPTALNQLHGEEPDEVVRALGPDVIKALRYEPSTIDSELARYDAMDDVGTILVDGSAGGMGETLDWAGLAGAIERVGVTTPIMLAGGLAPETVADAIQIVRPYAVDVSSGVERERGVKDPELIRAFCAAVRAADAAR